MRMLNIHFKQGITNNISNKAKWSNRFKKTDCEYFPFRNESCSSTFSFFSVQANCTGRETFMKFGNKIQTCLNISFISPLVLHQNQGVSKSDYARRLYNPAKSWDSKDLTVQAAFLASLMVSKCVALKYFKVPSFVRALNIVVLSGSLILLCTAIYRF